MGDELIGLGLRTQREVDRLRQRPGRLDTAVLEVHGRPVRVVDVVELRQLDAGERDAAGTLGGAFDIADRLPAETASSLTESARGLLRRLDVTAGIGVAVMLAAAALVAVVWRTPRAEG